MLIPTTCPICATTTFIPVKSQDWLDYVNGKLAQDAFPYLSADDREMIISGICPDCWNSMFGGEDE